MRTSTCSPALASAIVALGEHDTLRVFGRCHQCPDAPAAGRRFVREVPRVWPSPPRYGNRPEPERLPETADLVRFPNGWVGTACAMVNGYVTCPACGEPVEEWAGVKATYLASISCSADCEMATGENCKCSCNGANHGARA